MKLAHSTHAARHASLRYVPNTAPGIARIRRARRFDYVLPSGKPLRSRPDLDRITSLAIPPAWERVWICTAPDGHLQATGFDARGRKQYRYHPQWTAHRNLSKFAELPAFGAALPGIRRRMQRDLTLPGIPRDKVCACVVSLLDQALIRVGNSEYAKSNESYGLTTILDDHATIRNGKINFNFKAKSGKLCNIVIDSPKLAAIARRCQDLPGQELFAYIDQRGEPHDLTSTDVNNYLFETTSHHFTAKDFRTWGGTTIAAATLHAFGPPVDEVTGKPLSAAQLKKRETAAIKAASTALCNTPATCRKFYVHPMLIQAYADGRLARAFDKAAKSSSPRELRLPERALLHLLQGRSKPSA